MEKLEYLDFEVKVDPPATPATGLSVVYPVEARSSEGEASGELKLGLSTLEMVHLRDHCHELSPPEVEAFGMGLAEALFAGDVALLFRDSFRAAKAKRQGLRIRLRIRPPEVAAIPWEILHHPQIRVSLAIADWYTVVRYVDLLAPREALALDGPLRVLLVAANAKQGGLDELDLTSEITAVTQALERLGDRASCTILDGATAEDLYDALGNDDFHVLHFLGHGDFDDAAGEGVLYLEGVDGAAVPLPERELRQLVYDSEALRVVVLNACRSGRGSTEQNLAGLANSVARAGVPAVISMRYPISDEAALHFAGEFYLSLVDGAPVDRAVDGGRKNIQKHLRGTVEWLTPCLNMRSADGHLFAAQPGTQPHFGRDEDRAQQRLVEKVVEESPVAATEGEASVFALHVGVLEGYSYPVRLIGSPAGSASAQMVMPQVEPFLARLIRSGASDRSELETFGTALFEALIARPFESQYRESLEAAGGGSMLITVRTDSPDVHAIPWEMMRDPVTGTFLGAAGGRRRFLRHEPGQAGVAPFEPPLRILFARCEVLDQPPLELDREQDWLESAVANAGDFELRTLKDPSREQLLDVLDEYEPHILHFAGYDALFATGAAGDEGIVLMDEHGATEVLQVQPLVQMLQGRPALHLVVTNTCFTASRLGPALVRAGVPSAIGMRYGVQDDVAVRFTKLLYENLHRFNLRVDLALAETRRALYVLTDDQAIGDWSYPSLCTSVEGSGYFAR